MAATKWTVTTLVAQILGELNQDRNADGTAPTRLLNLVREAYDSLWTRHSWSFRRDTTNITGADATDLPSDFDKLVNRVAPETSGKGLLQITDDEDTFLAEFNKNINRTDCPEWGIVRPKGMVSSVFRYELAMTPSPDTAYTFSLVYLTSVPALADGGDAQWPLPFHMLWHNLAMARALRAFRRNDDWKEAFAFFNSELKQMIEENDRSVTPGVIPMEDGYHDLAALTSGHFLYGHGGQS